MVNSKFADSYDITKWQPGFIEYSQLITDRESSSFKDAKQEKSVIKKWKSREVYALISVILGIQPNGMMTKLSQGKPMNNLWWWDFVIKDNKNIINI